VTLSLPGEHNVRNALAAVAVAGEMGIPFETTARALGEFRTVERRFEIKGEEAGVMVVDDYAHHPTEIKASLAGARRGYDRRIVAVFQPHLYSRTRDFHQDFGRAFMNSDVLVVTDVYPAREAPIEGISGKMVADDATSAGHHHVTYVEKREELPRAVAGIVESGDLVITFGAGDINRVGTELLSILKESGNTGA